MSELTRALSKKLPPNWTAKTLEEVVHISSGTTPLRTKQSLYFDGGTIPWVKTGDLNNGLICKTDECITEVAREECSSCTIYPPDTVLVAMYGGFRQIGRTGRLGVSAAINQALSALKVKSGDLWPAYLQIWLNGRVELWKRLAASSRKDPNITGSDVSAFPIVLPPLSEQKAIAVIASTWDRAIELTQKLIAAKQQRKAALVQQLLTGKVWFGKDDPQYQSVVVGEVVEKVATALEVEPTATYREIGIRSHGKGIFHKEPVFGSVLGEKRVYKVESGCLTFNIVFAWERAIAVTTTDDAVFVCSHRFPMFKPKAGEADPKYLLAYFLSPKGTEMLELASPGGAGRNRTLGQTAFLKLKVPLPNIAFQQRFVSLIDTLDAELALTICKLDALRRQKKGLIQQLLTGKVRVKVTEPSGA